MSFVSPSGSAILQPVPRFARGCARTRLFWRVFFSGAMLLGLVTATSTTVGVLYERSFSDKRPPERLGAYLADQLSQASTDPARLATEVARAQVLIGSDLRVYARSGRTLAGSEQIELRFPDAGERAQLDRGEIVKFSGPRYFLPLKQNDAVVGYVVLDLPMPWRHRTLAVSLSMMGAVLLVLGLVSFALARTLTSPIEKLTDAALSLGRGDLSVRTRLKRHDELGELARAFDDMADRLSHLLLSEKELLANVSHELRTPLASIRVALELASEKPNDAQPYLAEIAASVGELETLVKDLLTAARLDLATSMPGPSVPSLSLVRVSGEALVLQAAKRFRHSHPERELKLEVAEHLPEVEVDSDLLRRLLDNLLDNARKYSDADEVVTLSAQAGPAGGGLVLKVIDSGIGIEPRELERLGTPFFRTDRSRARDTGGVGLGLHIARCIADAHHARLDVVSAVGQGTTVSVELPSVSQGRAA